MTQNNPQVPWTDEQWARVNQVILDEAQRARVAASFLPLFGPLPASADFVRRERVTFDPLKIDDKHTLDLLTLQLRVRVRGEQMADPEMQSVLALFRRAANVLARLEDALIFNGFTGDDPAGGITSPLPNGAPGAGEQISGGHAKGLLNDPGACATGSITWATNPAPGDTIDIAGATITFRQSRATGNDVDIGPNLRTTLQSLLTRLRGLTPSPLAAFSYALTNRYTLVIAAKTPGFAANNDQLAASNATPSAPRLTGGRDAELTPPTTHAVSDGNSLVDAVSASIGDLESGGHFGPFAAVLSQALFAIAQTPVALFSGGPSSVPQDRIIPFLGGGPLLRSSALPEGYGLVVAQGGAPIELVVATDMSPQFLQVADDSDFLFRVFEKVALRIRERDAIAALVQVPPPSPPPPPPTRRKPSTSAR